ncbi:hypothetical protein [Tychonema sp. LEGE 07203]|nr:hypothetical protein [Tychonema sp. LEGE 07203]
MSQLTPSHWTWGAVPRHLTLSKTGAVFTAAAIATSPVLPPTVR